MRLKNQTVVITGASSGLGKDLALAAANEGANIVLIARREAELKNLKSTLVEMYPVKCHYFVVDVTEENAVYDAFHQIEDQFDGIDVLINNAGYGLFQSVEQMTLHDMKQMFEVNVFGVMCCSKLALTSMKYKGKGHIINIASLAGKVATSKAAAYAGSKHAVLGFSNALRQEVENDGIIVTNVNPGPMDTPFFNIADESGTYAKSVRKLMLDPEKVAQKVISLIGHDIHNVDLPSWMGMGAKIYSLFPKMSHRFMMKFGNKK